MANGGGEIGLDGSCQNKRKSSIFKEPDGSIHDVDAFSKVPVKSFYSPLERGRRTSIR